MSDATESKPTWLPNLVSGISIWKLAGDLNEPKWLDGRLILPDVEGADSLPTKVSWHVEGLIPLPEARAKWPEATTAAIRDFFAAVEKVSAELANPASGFHQFKAAFSVPSLEADGGGNYFYSEQKKKLFVINWGASPRQIAGQKELVFGYDDFGRLFEKSGIARSGPSAADVPVAAMQSAGAPQAPAGDVKADAKKDEKKDDKKDEKKDDKKGALLWGRPWWHWLLVALAIVGILILILLLLRGCENPNDARDGGPDAAADGATDAATDAPTDAADDAATSPTGADAGDGGKDKDAGADAGDGGKDKDAGDDGGKDAGKDAGKDGGKSSGGGPGGGSSGGSSGPVNGGVIVLPGGGGSIQIPTATAPGDQTLIYSQPAAEHWRVVAGKEFLEAGSSAEGDGSTFVVVLKPGASVNAVKVQWQDDQGKWHQ